MTDCHLVSASLDSRVEGGLIDEVVTAGRPHQVQRLLSDDQSALAAEWLLGFDKLELLGPIHAQKWKTGTGELDAEVAAELWEIDNGPRFLELSTRVNVNQNPVGSQRQLEQTGGHADFKSPQAADQDKHRTEIPCRGRLSAPVNRRLCGERGWVASASHRSSRDPPGRS